MVGVLEGLEYDHPGVVVDYASVHLGLIFSDVPIWIRIVDNGLSMRHEIIALEPYDTTGKLHDYRIDGKRVIQEKAGSRVLRSDSLNGASAFFVVFFFKQKTAYEIDM